MNNLKLKELQVIFTGIENGKLLHDQLTYICGSARCVVGWAVELYLTDPNYADWGDQVILTDESWDNIQTFSAWFQEYFGLYASEAALIEDGHATRTLHRKVMQALAEGRRLCIDEMRIIFDYNSNYLGDAIIISDTDTLEIIADFLQIDYNKITPHFNSLGEKYGYKLTITSK